MVNPVPGRPVTTPYGRAGNWSGGRHGGADWAAPTGTPVVAAWSGTVTGASWGSAFGTQVVVDQDPLPDGSPGLWAVYAHLSESAVRPGQRIKAGQRIGAVGATGNATGPHLHYEVQRAAGWRSGNHADPAPWLAAGTAPAPRPPQQPDDRDEEEDGTMFIIRKKGGAAYLVVGATRAHGIHDAEDIRAFAKAGVPVVDLTDKTFESIRCETVLGPHPGRRAVPAAAALPLVRGPAAHPFAVPLVAVGRGERGPAPPALHGPVVRPAPRAAAQLLPLAGAETAPHPVQPRVLQRVTQAFLPHRAAPAHRHRGRRRVPAGEEQFRVVRGARRTRHPRGHGSHSRRGWHSPVECTVSQSMMDTSAP